MDSRISGTPNSAIRIQASASAAISASPAITSATGTAAIWTTSRISTPMPPASQLACTPSATAPGSSPAPCRRAERAVVP